MRIRQQGTPNKKVTIELCMEVAIVSMIIVPMLLMWLPDTPRLLTDFYYSTLSFILGLAL